MSGRSYKLFTILGFTVKIDPTWLILGALVCWSLAAGYFPAVLPGYGLAGYLVLGLIGAAGIFMSIVFHELCHSLVARREGIEMNSITLFMFGGVAEMGDEPPSPRAEFRVAIVGPLSSLVLSGLLYGAAAVAGHAWAAVFNVLASMNLVLALFNLIPAFPLDGGRVLRAALWARKGDLLHATRVTSRIGTLFALALVALGAAEMWSGNVIGGVWRVLIAMFVQQAAAQSYTMVVTREMLRGRTVGDLMRRDVPTVPVDATIDDLVLSYLPHAAADLMPVVDASGRFVGCVTLDDVQQIPRHAWPHRHVSEIVDSCDHRYIVDSETDAMDAVRVMARLESDQLLVVEGGQLLGRFATADVARYVAVQVRLQGDRPARPSERKPSSHAVPPEPGRGKSEPQPGDYPRSRFKIRAPHSLR